MSNKVLREFSTLAKDIALVSKPTIDSKQIDLSVPKFKIDSSSVRPAYYISDAQLYHGKKGFVVVHNKEKQVIEKAFMDKTARDMTKQQLKSFLKQGFFTLNQTNDGKFTLKANYRLNGGGPVFGKIMYWATKVTCYSVLVAATGAIVFGGGSVGVGVVKGAKGLKVIATTAKGIKAAKTAATTVKSLKVLTAVTQNVATSGILAVGGEATITTGCVVAGAGCSTVGCGAAVFYNRSNNYRDGSRGRRWSTSY